MASLLTSPLNVSILPEDLKLDIIKALMREEAKLEKNVKNALKHLAALKATMKFFGGTTPGTKLVYGKKRRKISAAGRARIAKAQRARWAKVRAAKAKKAA